MRYFTARKPKTNSDEPSHHKESWFKRNVEKTEFLFTMLTSIATLGALIMSIVVMKHQDNFAAENIKTQKQQFDSAQAEKRKDERQDSIRLELQALKDSIKFSNDTIFYHKQNQVLEKQNKLQEYLKNVQIDLDQPTLMFDSVGTLMHDYLEIYFTNTGKRPLKVLNSYYCIVGQTDNSNSDTTVIDTLLFSSQIIRANETAICDLVYADDGWHRDSTGDLIYFVTIQYQDIWENKIYSYNTMMYGSKDFVNNPHEILSSPYIAESYYDLFKSEFKKRFPHTKLPF